MGEKQREEIALLEKKRMIPLLIIFYFLSYKLDRVTMRPLRHTYISSIVVMDGQRHGQTDYQKRLSKYIEACLDWCVTCPLAKSADSCVC